VASKLVIVQPLVTSIGIAVDSRNTRCLPKSELTAGSVKQRGPLPTCSGPGTHRPRQADCNRSSIAFRHADRHPGMWLKILIVRKGEMALNPSNLVECAICKVVVLAVDVQARRDPRAYRRWEGQVLLCSQCAASLDRDLQKHRDRLIARRQ